MYKLFNARSNANFSDTTVTQVGFNIRQINISPSGQLPGDPIVSRNFAETVKVRNDEI